MGLLLLVRGEENSDSITGVPRWHSEEGGKYHTSPNSCHESGVCSFVGNGSLDVGFVLRGKEIAICGRRRRRRLRCRRCRRRRRRRRLRCRRRRLRRRRRRLRRHLRRLEFKP